MEKYPEISYDQALTIMSKGGSVVKFHLDFSLQGSFFRTSSVKLARKFVVDNGFYIESAELIVGKSQFIYSVIPSTIFECFRQTSFDFNHE